MQEYLDFAINIAKYAGKIIKDSFNKSYKIEFKSDLTPVTEIDKKINNYLIEQVKIHYPNHSVDGEEQKFLNNSNYVWVCDPLDGTAMFIRHVPISVFSLALVVNGIPQIGVIYDPFLNEMYTAIKGKGAYCNNERINVNTLSFGDLNCTIDYCMWDKAKFDTLKIIREIRRDVKTCQIGSVAHASMLIASGKISGEIFPGVEHGHCDIAASKLIVEEAGGKVTDFYGNEQKYDQDINGAILTNGIIHDIIIKKIKEEKL